MFVCLTSVDYCYGVRHCSGHGTCREISLSPLGGAAATSGIVRGYQCDCDHGYEGLHCDVQRCVDGVACMNGGSCR